MKSTKKLTLRRESIRALEDEHLRKAAAGWECTVTQGNCSASALNLCQNY